MKLGKKTRQQNSICRKWVNIIVKRSKEILIPCISVCLGQAYKPHFCESPIQGSLIPKFGPHGHCETPGSNGIQIYISKNFDRRKLRDVFHEIPQIGID